MHWNPAQPPKRRDVAVTVGQKRLAALDVDFCAEKSLLQQFLNHVNETKSNKQGIQSQELSIGQDESKTYTCRHKNER